MRIQRHITQAGESPFAGISARTIDVEDCTSDPQRRVCLTDIEVPAHWSREASETFVRYYVRRAGVPVATIRVKEEGVPEFLWRSVPDTAALMSLPTAERTTHERSYKQVIQRMVGMWTYWGFKGGYFESAEDAQAYYDETCALLARQMMAPNSPQWFNAGLHWAYGMTGPAQGHFYGEQEDGRLRRSVNAYERPQLAACFIHGVRDELVNEGGIMHLFEREVRSFKYGSGAGVNMSPIRGSGESLSTGGGSSGLLRFMAVGDKAAGAVRSGGLPRRAGKMVVVDIDHPDVLNFIRWKGEEQYKAAALITGARLMRKYLTPVMKAMEAMEGEGRCDPEQNGALKHAIAKARRNLIPSAAIDRVLDYARQGFREVHIPIYSAEKDSEVFFTVGAHQGRQAVRVTNRFMQAAEDNHRFALRRRTDGSVSAQEEAGTILDELAHATWAAGEPTIHFADAIAAANPCPESGPIRASTPASEYFFLDDTASPLACINLLALADARGYIDTTLLAHTVKLTTLMLDISVGVGQYPSREMARRTLDTRPLGLGFANLAPLVMRLGYGYNSEQARATAAAIAGLITSEAQVVSAEIAKELGAFADFNKNRVPYLKMVSGRRELLAERMPERPFQFEALPQPELLEALKRTAEMAQIKTEVYGSRNAQLTCVPPTSTIARVMDCETLGLAPVATLVRLHQTADGSMRKTVSNNVAYGLRSLGYEEGQLRDITAYACGHGTLKGCPEIHPESLAEKGFTAAQLSNLEEALKDASDIHAAFDPWTVGERFCRDVLRLNSSQIYSASFSLLRHLGYSDAQIEAANRYACGAQSLADAPGLNPQHAEVFATSTAPEALITAEAQVALMASVQPFISGGIAHTITLSRDTSTSRCRDLIANAWHAGLKSLSLYRETSALYEDLYAGVEHEEEEPTTVVFREARASMPVHEPETVRPAAVVPSTITEVAAQLTQRWLQQRRELPARRRGFTQKATVAGHTLYVRTGEYEDGALGELAIDMPAEPLMVRTMVQQFSRAISLALQYGVPLSAFVEAFARTQFTPHEYLEGSIEGSEVLAEASAILGYVFGEIEQTYARYAVPAERPSTVLPLVASA